LATEERAKQRNALESSKSGKSGEIKPFKATPLDREILTTVFYILFQTF